MCGGCWTATQSWSWCRRRHAWASRASRVRTGSEGCWRCGGPRALRCLLAGRRDPFRAAAHCCPAPCAGTVALPDGSTQQLLAPGEAALVQRFDPSAELDTIGFFIAKFRKRAAAA